MQNICRFFEEEEGTFFQKTIKLKYLIQIHIFETLTEARIGRICVNATQICRKMEVNIKWKNILENLKKKKIMFKSMLLFEEEKKSCTLCFTRWGFKKKHL